MITISYLGGVLQEAKNVHLSLHHSVDFKAQNAKQAIYIIQGGVITGAILAIRFHCEGLMTARAQQARLINESRELVEYFQDLPDDHRHLRAWFAGKIVERPLETLASRKLAQTLTPEQVKRYDTARKSLYNHLSAYGMHATINSLRSNMSQSSSIFDYDHAVVPKPAKDITVAELGTFYVTPALQTLLMPMHLFPELQIAYGGLRKHIDRIETSAHGPKGPT